MSRVLARSHSPVGGVPAPPPAVEPADAEAERRLTEEVDRVLLSLGAALRDVNGGLSHSPDEAAAQFLHANGVATRSNSIVSISTEVPTPGPHNSSSNNNYSITVGGGGAAVEGLRADLAKARSLVRRIDSERRHYRQIAARLGREVTTNDMERHAVQRSGSEAHQRAHALEAQLGVARAATAKAEERNDVLTVELMRLRRFVRALPPQYANGFSVMEEDPSRIPEVVTVLGLVPDRRFNEAFSDKMGSIVNKRRYRQARALYEATAERLEALTMEMCDTINEGHSRSFVEAQAAAQAAAGRGLRLSSVTSASASQGGRLFASGLVDFPFQLPFSPATPKDDYIKALLYKSRFSDTLSQGRSGLLRLSTRLKSTLDTGLRGLYGAHHDVVRASGGTADMRPFEEQLRRLQHAHRELMFSLVAQVNDVTVALLEQERAAGGGSAGGAAAARATRDVGTMAVSTTADDYEAHLAKERANQQRLRALESEMMSSKRLAHAEAQREAAQQQTLLALSSLRTLGQAAVEGARLRAKRRWKGHGITPADAANTVLDPFAPSRFEFKSVTDLDDPRLQVKVTEATDVAARYINQLIADTSGAPLSARGKASSATDETLPRFSALEEPGLASMFNGGGGGGVRARSGREQPPPPPPPPPPPASASASFTSVSKSPSTPRTARPRRVSAAASQSTPLPAISTNSAGSTDGKRKKSGSSEEDASPGSTKKKNPRGNSSSGAANQGTTTPNAPNRTRAPTPNIFEGTTTSRTTVDDIGVKTSPVNDGTTAVSIVQLDLRNMTEQL